MIDKRYIKAKEISHTDYSGYENPLREILEYRKMACSILEDTSEENREELFSIINYSNRLLKRHLNIW